MCVIVHERSHLNRTDCSGLPLSLPAACQPALVAVADGGHSADVTDAPPECHGLGPRASASRPSLREGCSGNDPVPCRCGDAPHAERLAGALMSHVALTQPHRRTRVWLDATDGSRAPRALCRPHAGAIPRERQQTLHGRGHDHSRRRSRHAARAPAHLPPHTISHEPWPVASGRGRIRGRSWNMMSMVILA